MKMYIVYNKIVFSEEICNKTDDICSFWEQIRKSRNNEACLSQQWKENIWCCVCIHKENRIYVLLLFIKSTKMESKINFFRQETIHSPSYAQEMGKR